MCVRGRGAFVVLCRERKPCCVRKSGEMGRELSSGRKNLYKISTESR